MAGQPGTIVTQFGGRAIGIEVDRDLGDLLVNLNIQQMSMEMAGNKSEPVVRDFIRRTLRKHSIEDEITFVLRVLIGEESIVSV